MSVLAIIAIILFFVVYFACGIKIFYERTRGFQVPFWEFCVIVIIWGPVALIASLSFVVMAIPLGLFIIGRNIKDWYAKRNSF
tara:strand:- start:1638 stop:1886 length:249 start_codon:yes stop_codon:yes gene_type:complete